MKKLFTNDKFFLAMVLCAVIGEAAFALITILVWNVAVQSNIVLLLRLVCVVALYCSYKKHNKNVMKGMCGALLMAQLITAILCVSDAQRSVECICFSIFAILSALLFMNHFIINTDRKASPTMITFNQVFVLLLFINNTVLDIYYLASQPFSVAFPLLLLVLVCDMIGFLGMAAVVVCVESRLDAYRLDRESAGWTEEKGYPANYDRTKNYGVNNKKKK